MLLWRRIEIPRSRLTSWAPDLAAEPDKVFDIPAEQLVALKASWVEVEESTVLIRGGKVRLDGAWAGEQAGYVVVDLNSKTALLVLPEEGKVVEVTDRETVALRDRLADAERLARKTLPDLGAKEQARAKKLLRGLTGTKKRRPVRSLGVTRRIHELDTRGYELRTDDTVVRGWVTQGPADVVRQFRKAQETRRRFDPFGGAARRGAGVFIEYGLPVLVQSLGPERYQVEELVRIDRRTVPASSFEIPAGLERTSLEEMVKSTLRAANGHTPAPTPRSDASGVR